MTGGASLAVASNGSRVLRTSSLSISSDSKLNLNDNDLILDLESVVVNGQRYAVKADSNRIATNDIVGSIVGAISGGRVRGRAVVVPRGTEMTFRLERPLDIGVADRGVMRNGQHYHDYYRDRDNRDNSGR